MRNASLLLVLLCAGLSGPAGADVITSAAVEPYLSGTAWAAGAKAAQAGRLDEARRLLAGLELPEGEGARLAARILQARLASDPEASARALGRLSAEDPVAGPWLVLAALRAGSADAALLAQVPAGHPAEDEARLTAASRLEAAGEGEGALEVLGDPGRFGPRLRPEALALSARLSEPGAAGAAWKRLYLEHPGHPSAKPALERLGALAVPPPSHKEEAARLERLLDSHANDQVIREAEALLARIDPKTPLGCKVRFYLGKAHRKARNYHDAKGVLSKVMAECKGPKTRVRSLYLLASVVSIAEKDPAVPLYEQLVAEFPKHAFADDALFFIADLHLRGGRPAEAGKVLARQVAAYPEGDYHAEALWRLFWIQRRGGRSEAGLVHLDAILAAFARAKDPFDVERALYWKARTLAEGEAAAGAAPLYERLVREHPLSYHALQALPRLGALDPKRAAALRAALPEAPATAPGFSLEVRPGLARSAAVKGGIHLLRLGLHREAAQVLEGAGPEAKSQQEVLLLAMLLDRAGDPHRAHWLIRTRAKDFDRQWPEGERWAIWRAAYPLAFREKVVAATTEFGVPVELQQALIREESALDPEVVSWAGAVGLAQLMPYTAKDVARRMGVKIAVDAAALKDPDLNLRISARYLSDLLRLAHGNVALAIASYNAGERTVLGWARRHNGKDLDTFIEEISIAETRRYTRRVLRSYATYSFLYGEGEGRFLVLPERVELPAP